MYLDFDFVKEFLDGNYCIDSGITDNITQYDYDDINHAYDLLKSDTKSSRIDIILNLRRSVNLRVAQLENSIGFSNIKHLINKGKKEKLEKLGELGVIKPLLIKKLLKIRNDVEYRKKTEPPDSENCQELIDIVWYFYKSTDKLINFTPDNFLIEFQEDKIEYFLLFEFDFKQHEKIKLRGRIPPKMINKEKSGKNFKIYNYESKIQDCDDILKNKEIGSFVITGEVVTSEILQYCNILQVIFSNW